MKIFKGKKPEKPKRDFKILAFDSETEGFAGDTKFITYACEYDEYTYAGYCETWDTFFNFLYHNRENFTNHRLYAHNMGFDLGRATATILDWISKGHSFDVLQSGENIISLLWLDENKEQVVQFCDSFALFPQSLASFTSKFSPHLQKMSGSIDFSCEVPDINNPTHLEYGIVDSLSLLHALSNFDDLLYNHFSVHAKLTAASTAMHALRVTLPTKNFGIPQLSKNVEEFCRKAYFGGWVGLGKNSNNLNVDCYHFDISSSYPASMLRFGVPRGTPFYTQREIPSQPAIYKVKVNVPRGTIPVVPSRLKNGIGWRYGEYETYLTSIDITNARLSEINVEVIDGYVFEEMIFPFNDFIAKCRELRIIHKKEATEDVAKLMQNSVYGKFAMSREGTRVTISDQIDEKPRELHRTLIDHFRHEEEEERDAIYILPHWAAFITAGARLNLHNIIRNIDFDNFIYADTDSVVMTKVGFEKLDKQTFLQSPSETEQNIAKYGSKAASFTEYGKFALENQYLAFRALAPKVYGAVTHELTIKGRAKGIPRKSTSSKLFIDFLKNEEVADSFYYDSISSFAAILKGQHRVVNRNRKLSSVRNSSNWKKKGGIVVAKNYDD